MPDRIWRDKTRPTVLNVASPFEGAPAGLTWQYKKEDKEALCVHFDLFWAPLSPPRR